MEFQDPSLNGSQYAGGVVYVMCRRMNGWKDRRNFCTI